MVEGLLPECEHGGRRGRQGRSRGDFRAAHDCPPHPSSPARVGVEILASPSPIVPMTSPFCIVPSLAAQQTHLQELGLGR